MITMTDKEISKKCLAIVMFGFATDSSGMRPAEYYQVTLDPKFVSPNGEYIRFGQNKGDEIIGWQRLAALTICEIIAEYPDEGEVEIPMTGGAFNMRAIDG